MLVARGGAHKSGSERGTGGSGNGAANIFPGTDGNAFTRPPRNNEPRHKVLSGGEEVVWCSKCSKWTDHYTAGHPEIPGAIPAEDESNEGNVEEV